MKSIRKGQLEIMGLVVIVILIALAMVFLIQFSLLREPETARKVYTQSQIATNTLNALMETKNTCLDEGFAPLIKDCMSGTGVYECGIPTCEYVEREIGVILNDTLVQWQKNYELRIYVGSQNINIAEGQCLGDKDSSLYYITSAAGRIFIELDVCSK